jgi:hypothetical protein
VTDQIVEWLYGDTDSDDEDKDEDGDLIDLSELGSSDQYITVESGVTSGADPSSWEEIVVDSDRNGCADANGTGAGANGPAICHTEEKK